MVRAFRCQVRLLSEQPADPRWQPFCSERCNLLDLHAWLGGQYRIPDEPVPQAEDDSGRGDGGSDE